MGKKHFVNWAKQKEDKMECYIFETKIQLLHNMDTLPLKYYIIYHRHQRRDKTLPDTKKICLPTLIFISRPEIMRIPFRMNQISFPLSHLSICSDLTTHFHLINLQIRFCHLYFVTQMWSGFSQLGYFAQTQLYSFTLLLFWRYFLEFCNFPPKKLYVLILRLKITNIWSWILKNVFVL